MQPWANPTRKQMKRNAEQLRDLDYFIPRECSTQDLHVLWVSVQAKLPLFIPKKLEPADLIDSGYKLKANGSYEFVGATRFRTYPSINRDAVELIVKELAYQKYRRPLWCEDIVVDYDYILILLFLLNKRKYNSLMSKDTKTMDSSSVTSKLSKLNSTIEKSKSGIISSIFSTLRIDEQLREQEESIDELLSQMQNSCMAFANNTQFDEKSEYGKIVLLWAQEIAKLKNNKGVETPRSVFEARYQSNKQLVFIPEPLTQQTISPAGLRELHDLAHLTMVDPEKKGEYYDVPHDLIFDNPANPNEPELLRKMKAIANKAMENGDLLTKAQVMDMLDAFWVFNPEKQALAPNVQSQLFFIPEIPSVFIPKEVREHLLSLDPKAKEAIDLTNVQKKNRHQAPKDDPTNDKAQQMKTASLKGYFKDLESMLDPNQNASYLSQIKLLQSTSGCLFFNIETIMVAYVDAAKEGMGRLEKLPQYLQIGTDKSKIPLLFAKASELINSISTNNTRYRILSSWVLGYFSTVSVCARLMFIFRKNVRPGASKQLGTEELKLFDITSRLMIGELSERVLDQLDELELDYQYVRTTEEREEQEALILRGEQDIDSNLNVREEEIVETPEFQRSQELVADLERTTIFENQIFLLLDSIQLALDLKIEGVLDIVKKDPALWKDTVVWVILRNPKAFIAPELIQAFNIHYFSLRSMIIIYGTVIMIAVKAREVFAKRTTNNMFDLLPDDEKQVKECIKLIQELMNALNGKMDNRTTVDSLIKNVQKNSGTIIYLDLPHDKFYTTFNKFVEWRTFAKAHSKKDGREYFDEKLRNVIEEVRDAILITEFREKVSRTPEFWLFSDFSMNYHKSRSVKRVSDGVHMVIESCYGSYNEDPVPKSSMISRLSNAIFGEDSGV